MQLSSDEARRQWRRLLNGTEAGELAAITRYGEVCAYVVPPEWFRKAQTAMGDKPGVSEMTTFYATVGAEYAEWLASSAEGPGAGQPGAVIDDLGDGRVTFGRNTLAILRKMPPDFDGSVSEDDGALALWMGGQPYPVTGTMEPNEEGG